MHIILKIVFPIVVVYLMIIGFYRLYKLLNDKIVGSNSLLSLVGYSLLLIAANIILFFGGLLFLFEVYLFLA